MRASAPAAAAGMTAAGQLLWDGLQWWLVHGDQQHPGRPEVVWDFDRAMAVRWHGDGPRWLWLARRREPSGWHALRVALMHAAAP